ncbi:MAG: hypothetical protein IJA29_08640 [Lachnospiraceae bacterium]|nr:hypothetical protein [Lachnospiraceae bacterium]
MAFDWEGLLGEDGYRHVCDYGLDCYEDYHPYHDEYYDYDDYDDSSDPDADGVEDDEDFIDISED